MKVHAAAEFVETYTDGWVVLKTRCGLDVTEDGPALAPDDEVTCRNCLRVLKGEGS